MKCYKCDREIAVVEFHGEPSSYKCLCCLYEEDRNFAKQIMPFTKLELEKIRNSKKWTSLRSLKYDKYPFEKKKVYVAKYGIREFNNDLLYCHITDDVVKSEGFITLSELITALKKKGFKLLQGFWLYDLRKPI